MNLDEAQTRFVQVWGALGSHWGINRTMAQLHATLLITTRLLSTDDLMSSLQISRGNANMNLRMLVDWGLIYKEVRPGIRREFFRAERNIWEVAKRIATERRKRELEPLLQAMEELRQINDPAREPSNEYKHFISTVDDIRKIGNQVGGAMDILNSLNAAGFLEIISKLSGDREG